MLKTKNLTVKIDDKVILEDINITLPQHSITALIGPNGSGKTTLFKALFNYYSIKKDGEVFFKDENITHLEVNEIAQKGIHLMQQNPESISGLKTIDLLQTLVTNEDKVKEMSDFYTKVLKRLQHLDLTNEILSREVNRDWSGGEKKKFQALLVEILQPKLLLIDEIDTALDVDALKKVCSLIKEYYDTHPECTIFVISHSNFIFNYLKPNHVYLISNKTVAAEGDYELITKVEREGYKQFQSPSKHHNKDYEDPLKGL